MDRKNRDGEGRTVLYYRREGQEKKGRRTGHGRVENRTRRGGNE